MNIKKMTETYQALGEISDYGPDIFQSEYSRDCLEEAGVPGPDAASALLRMQLEQERLSQIPPLQSFPDSREDRLSMVRCEVVSELQKRLAYYTREQQSGICLFMMENLDSMRGYTCTELQRVQRARLSLEALMESAADGLLQCAGRLFEENGAQLSRFEQDGQTEEAVLHPLASPSATAAAAAVAFYAECPEYRGSPEWAAESAYMIRDVWSVDVDYISFVLVILSATLLLSILFASALTSAGVCVAVGAEVTWANITKEFVSLITAYKIELLAAAGIGIAGLVINGADKLIKLFLIDSRTAEAAQRDASVENAGYDTYSVHQIPEEEEDDESDALPSQECQRA